MAAPFENRNPLWDDEDVGGGEEQNGGRRRRHDEELLYNAEPERLFHQGRREQRDEARIQAARAQAEELFERLLREQAEGGEQNLPVNNQGQRARMNQHGPVNNPLPPRIQQPRQQQRGRPSLKEFSIPNLGNNSWCIEADAEMEAFELRTNIVHFLPKFAGLPGEVATQHLKEYEGVCKSFQPYGMTPDKYRLGMFPFSLTDIAKSWFLSLPSGSIHTWDQMQKSFLEKFYPVGKANQIRKELSNIKQGALESTYEYLERFNELEQSCCNLALPDYLVINYLLDGLRPMERRMLDAAAGGSVMNLDPDQIRALIKETAESARFTDTLARRDEPSRTRNVSQVETNNNQLAEEVKELREMMRTMMAAQGNAAKACEFCNSTGHKTDECPTLQVDTEGVNAVGFQQPNNQNPKYGLAANGFSWKQGGFPNQQNQQQQPPYHPPHTRPNYQNQQRNQQHQGGHANNQQERSLEDIVKQMQQQMSNQMQELNRTVGGLSKQMEVNNKQIAQLTTDVAEIKAEAGKLPSQTVPNPKSGVNAIMLISEQGLEDQKAGSNEQKPVESACVLQVESACSPDTSSNFDAYEPPLPFPDALKKPKKSTELDPDLLELFSKVELTIPLIDAIKQVPKYAKFLKELCTKRRGIVKAEQKPLKKHGMAAIISQGIIPKNGDRGMFIIPCIIGTRWKNNCMLDIGSAINVIPDSIYRTMQIGPLRSTSCMVQLANKSCARPEGILYDVLVRVEELVFLADFYVLQDDIKENTVDSRIILGRPFMVTARTKTDSWTGEVSVEGNGRKVTLNGYNNLHDPPDTAGEHVNAIDKNVTWDPKAVGKRKAISMQQEKSVQPMRYGLNSIKIHVPTKSCPSKLQVPRYEWKPVQKQLGCKALNKKKKKSPFSRKGPDKAQTLDAPPIKT